MAQLRLHKTQEPRRSPESDDQWKDLVHNPAAEKAFDAEVAAEEQRLGRPLTGHELGKIAHKYAS